MWLENILAHTHLWQASTQIVCIYIYKLYLEGLSFGIFFFIIFILVSEFYGFAKWTFFYVSPTAFFSKVAFIKTESVTIVVFKSSLFFHLALYFSPLLFLCYCALGAYRLSKPEF